MKSKYLAAFLLCAVPSALYADFSYTETTQITGGSIVGLMRMAGVFSRQARQAGDPIISTVMVKGNRMVRSNAMRTEIVDLDKETITTIDHTKKQYTTMTFQQMKQQLEEAQARQSSNNSSLEQTRLHRMRTYPSTLRCVTPVHRRMSEASAQMRPSST